MINKKYSLKNPHLAKKIKLNRNHCVGMGSPLSSISVHHADLGKAVTVPKDVSPVREAHSNQCGYIYIGETNAFDFKFTYSHYIIDT